MLMHVKVIRDQSMSHVTQVPKFSLINYRTEANSQIIAVHRRIKLSALMSLIIENASGFTVAPNNAIYQRLRMLRLVENDLVEK